MIRSMTGFAHREISSPGLRGSMEIKSYNNRYLDLQVSLPAYLARLEPRFRSFLAARAVHGKIELYLRVRELDAPVRAEADFAAAAAVASVLRQVAERSGLAEPPRLSDLLSFEGVVAFEREIDEEATWALLEAELAACCADWDDSRLREGASTLADLQGQLGRIERGLGVVRARLPEIESSLRSQLRARFTEVLGDAVQEDRILAELAPLLVKYSLNEEVSRLSAHLASFARILADERAPAKKLDFLGQEMGREINTIGSKNMLLPVAEAVVELKDALENVREQLRNIE